jgi:hypothetical protein
MEIILSFPSSHRVRCNIHGAAYFFIMRKTDGTDPLYVPLIVNDAFIAIIMPDIEKRIFNEMYKMEFHECHMSHFYRYIWQ